MNTELIGQSNALLGVLEQTYSLAQLTKPVLVVGERGTGKELIAHRLHYLSARWQQAFVSLNCATLAETLLESELFGHEVGAFTGAQKRHLGRFERANGGTLFLDELASTSPRVQEKLLRVIEYGEFERVGGSQAVRVDVRLVCASNQDLPALAEKGDFRADLLDRLAFDVITLPPLRARGQDIIHLAEHFAVNFCMELGWPLFAGFSASVRQQLLDFTWPGNVRELKNVIERSLYRHAQAEVELDALYLDPFASPWRPSDGAATSSTNAESKNSPSLVLPLDLKAHLAQQEVDWLSAALRQSQYHQRQAAQLLGLSYHQLRGLLRKHAGKLPHSE
ncbi:phage shock protein operon transcriptional activator [Oceanisphaera sp. IT1-181]|uniref:phage shock protein operon transcriptional activator n=1 Tax=Oceanisphaera sp. IT1-181 TaxID=3081199 RepID=UPI0029C9D71E|nr:phage shock protein operon transcriptional activator [Oceanisphaera sp. IT1-181]